MIEHIRTIGFKGFDLDEPVPQKVVYCGKNKSGKSTRAGAIALAIYGHIPFSTTGKRTGDILDSFGNDSLVVAVTIGGTEFGRKFSRNAKGVSQIVQVDKKRVSSENFAILLDRAGGPKIANVAEFMKQSESKKVDTLFDLFPNPELVSIDTEIENAKADVSRLEKKKSGVESTIVRLTNSKQFIEIPAGSIAEVQTEIKSVKDQISDLEEQIKAAEIEAAEIEAAEKARIEAEIMAEKARIEAATKAKREKEDAIEAERKRVEDKKKASEAAESKAEGERREKERAIETKIDDVKVIFNQEAEKLVETEISKEEQQISDFMINNGMGVNQDLPEKFKGFDSRELGPRELQRAITFQSIQRIIDALKGAGCNTCAALIVAKQELKKLKELS